MDARAPSGHAVGVAAARRHAVDRLARPVAHDVVAIPDLVGIGIGGAGEAVEGVVAPTGRAGAVGHRGSGAHRVPGIRDRLQARGATRVADPRQAVGVVVGILTRHTVGQRGSREASRVVVAVRGGVVLPVGDAGQLPPSAVAVRDGVATRVWEADALSRRVVGVGDGTGDGSSDCREPVGGIVGGGRASGAIDQTRAVAPAAITVLDVVGAVVAQVDLHQPVAGVVTGADDGAVGGGHTGPVARRVVSHDGRGSVGAGHGGHIARRAVAEGRGVAVDIGDGRPLPRGVVAVPSRLVQRVALAEQVAVSVVRELRGMAVGIRRGHQVVLAVVRDGGAQVEPARVHGPAEHVALAVSGETGHDAIGVGHARDVAVGVVRPEGPLHVGDPPYPHIDIALRQAAVAVVVVVGGDAAWVGDAAGAEAPARALPRVGEPGDLIIGVGLLGHAAQASVAVALHRVAVTVDHRQQLVLAVVAVVRHRPRAVGRGDHTRVAEPRGEETAATIGGPESVTVLHDAIVGRRELHLAPSAGDGALPGKRRLWGSHRFVVTPLQVGQARHSGDQCQDA